VSASAAKNKNNTCVAEFFRFFFGAEMASAGQFVGSPSQRVATILERDEDLDDDTRQTHELFCELEELRPIGENGELMWKETARWVKFEENVEEGGDRWSKPHVATLSLHSLFELRKCLMRGTVLMDLDASTMPQIADLVVDHMAAAGKIDPEVKDKVADIMLRKHRHQHQLERREGSSRGLPVIRSLADIGRKMSSKTLEQRDPPISPSPMSPTSAQPRLTGELKTASSGGSNLGVTPGSTSTKDLQQSANVSNSSSAVDMSDPYKYNQHFIKKVPTGAEAAVVMVGEVDFLPNGPISAFLRLQKGAILEDVSEVAIPVKFIFLLLGPPAEPRKYREIGRSIGTLMSDEVFHDVAYKARTFDDMLAALDEFLDCVTVLPPGEWDPTIRIEPPKSVPSQAKRKRPPVPVVPVAARGGEEGGDEEKGGMPNGRTAVAVVEEEQHGDPTLVMTGKFCGGLVNDVKRKWPWYASDFKDAIHVQSIATCFFMYFACLTPIITFGNLLGQATGNYIAAMESLVSGCVCGVTYHLFGGQPLTIIGSTGPVLVFETIVYKFCKSQHWNYLEFRFWIGMWMVIWLLMMVAFDLSSLVRFITRFTEESFAMLIAIIFIYEAFLKLYEQLDHYPVNLSPDEPLDYNCTCLPPPAPNITGLTTTAWSFDDAHATLNHFTNGTTMAPINWDELTRKECTKLSGSLVGSGCETPFYVPDVFFLSCLLFIGTFTLSMGLKNFRNTRYFPNKVRIMISDFAVFLAICTMVFTDWLIGLDTMKLLVPEKFTPTNPDRSGWVVNPFGHGNPWYCFLAGLPPSLLATILIFMDQQITSVIINRKEHKLKKGGGYHLDLLLITIQIMFCTFFGTPWFVAATVLSINHVRSLTMESETAAPGERPKFLGIREQRVTGTIVFILVGVSAFLANVLKIIPVAVLYGVFLFMGLSSLKGIQFVQRVMCLLMPSKYQPDYMFLRNVRTARVHLFTLVQFCCLAGLMVIKEIKSISIVFPLMVLAMCFIRKGLDYVFTQHELKWLDDIMPDMHKREMEKKRKQLMLEAERAAGEDSGRMAIEESLDTKNPTQYGINISDEMTKTAIWQDMEYREKSDLRARKGYNADLDVEKGKSTPTTTKFKIGDEGEDETDALIGQPKIDVDSPSSGKDKLSNV